MSEIPKPTACSPTCQAMRLIDTAVKIERERTWELTHELAACRLRCNELQIANTRHEDREEVRPDGKTVRKDRWENGFRNIVSLLGMSSREFEIEDVVEAVRTLVEKGAATSNRPRTSDGEPSIPTSSRVTGAATHQKKPK